MASSSTTTTTTIEAACTNFAGAQVTITVPSSGTVVVEAQAWVRFNHVLGTQDTGAFVVAALPTDCAPGFPNFWPVQVPADAPTLNPWNFGVFCQRAFSVTAGTHTFYLNGGMAFGQDAADVFAYGNMVAVFYPS